MAKPKNGHARKAKGSRKTKTVDKADETEVRTLDLQQIEIDDADFDMHFRALKSAKEKMATAKNLYDGCCKAAKKVSEELLNAVKRAIKFEGMDAADIKRQLEIDGYVLKRTGSPVQLTIHDSLAGDVEDAAYKRGKDDAANGRGCKSPYPDGTELDTAYKTGWRNGIGGSLGLSEAETEEAVNGGQKPPAPAGQESSLAH